MSETVLTFRCRECGDTNLIETMKDVVVTSECSLTEIGLVYGEQTNEDGEVVGYQCGNGHNIMAGRPGNQRLVTTEEELICLDAEWPFLSPFVLAEKDTEHATE